VPFFCKYCTYNLSISESVFAEDGLVSASKD
jgi:hypothetical protein